MTPERYRQLNALADAALAMHPERRAAFVDEVCGSDSQLRQQLEAMLVAESGDSTFLHRPVLEELAEDIASGAPRHDLSGRRIRNYEVISRLGEGGIGEVWLVRDLNLNRHVALKLLSPRFVGDPSHVRRFQQEARATSSLNHPNIVTVYEISETGGMLFIAQEYVSGETIRQRLQRGPLPVAETVKIAAQAAAALNAAHSAGMVHRDVKPENIMIRPDGLVKVLDFGLARFVEKQIDTDSLSVPGFVLGTVRYMSPEQARGLAVDKRSDIFSLGVMLYEMTAGQPPFAGATPTDTLAAILTSEPPPLSRIARDIPPGFERIVQQCLAKDPAARYSSAADLCRDLEGVAVRLVKPGLARRKWIFAAAAAVVTVAAAVLVTDHRPAPLPAPFAAMQITRLDTDGEPADAAISGDGKLIAWFANEPSGQSLRIRNVSDSQERIALSTELGDHSGTVFSPDNAWIYYRLRTPHDAGELYRVASKGGRPQRLVADVSGNPALSPDGRRIAFLRVTPSTWEVSVMVSNADGAREFALATLRRPRYFDEHCLAWSPDGQSIACFTGNGARYSQAASRLVEIRLNDRTERTITPDRWWWPQSLAWARRGDVLVVGSATPGGAGYQLRTVTHRDGAVGRLTNDLTTYDKISVTNDGRTVAAIQHEISAHIWISAPGDPDRAVPIEDIALHSQKVSVAWTPDGQLAYADVASDHGNIWVVGADGRNARRLTSGAEEKQDLAITPEGRYMIYKQLGNLWRVDADGSHPRKLTDGPLDVHPDVTADSHQVVYASFVQWSPGVGGEPTIWKVPIDGGTPVQVSSAPASWPRVSPNGRQLGCLYFPAKDPRFSENRAAVLPFDGTGLFQFFESPPVDGSPLAWSPDGDALDYLVRSSDAANIWRQPTKGGHPHQVTSFPRDGVYAFAWSRQGRLACVRGTTTRSVVLIENFR